jgi:hypothetical protein
MLDLSRKPSALAQDLHAELGQSAFSFVSSRVEEARQASDLSAVQAWNDVGSELLALGRRLQGDDRRGSFPWALMQRIEYYRHRASEVERKAVAAPEAYRQDLLEVAAHWRDLALHAALQAQTSGET